MRINKVINKTGLSKRTIYYYIEEGFISPATNPENGYYDFTDKDVERLKFLNALRKADFSIKTIHIMLDYPQTAYVQVEKQIEKLKKEQILISEKIRSLKTLADKLPILVSDETFAKIVSDTQFPDENKISDKIKQTNVNLVSYYLWGPFVQKINMTEYRKYLWNRILDETQNISEETLKTLKNHLYSLGGEELEDEFIRRVNHIEQIISLTDNDMEDYVKYAMDAIDKMLDEEGYIKMWKENYYSNILPATLVYDSEFNSLVSELTDRFFIYHKNIHRCCKMIYDKLETEEGHVLKRKIEDCLEGHIDFSANHNGEIAALLGTLKIF